MRTATLLLAACTAAAPVRPMRLSKVVLYQNGIGYFERRGHLGGDTLHLPLARAEVDDVLKTMTVIDRLGAAVATVDVPTFSERDRTVELGVRLAGGRVHDVAVSYAVPTPTWKAAYRVVLDDHSGGLLQAWAMVNNASEEDWNGIALTLATGAPMSYALDLHTPEYVQRPDATGHVQPVVRGPVAPEQVGAADRDNDGVPDAVDRCPDDPETFNGFQDEDGCPDRGRVVVTASAIQVLQQIYFPRGAESIPEASHDTIAAVAATLRGNPDIAKLEIGGHASTDEPDPWRVSTRRAGAVLAALVSRGVDRGRLVVVPYGATRPIDPAAPDKNRRVDFTIAARREPEHAHAGAIDVATAQASVHAATRPVDVAGSTRYDVSEPVSIRRGASTLVSILDHKIAADDALLFRPDANAPGSARHPFRAVRLANDSGFTLEPGPIAIFARGTFVGDSLLGRLDVGETAWIPYAVEGGTTVTVTSDATERPVRIVSIRRGAVIVEAAGIRVTRYAIAAGREPAKQIFIRHAKTAGFDARDLPPATLDQGDAYLVPLPLQPGKTSVLSIEEREPRRRTIQLLDQDATQLGLYLEGSHLPSDVAERIRAAVELRTQIGAIEERLDGMRDRMADLAERADELRENLKALDKVHGADELRKQLVASLAHATGDADTLARSLALENETLATARGKLADALRDLTLPDAP